MPRPPSRGWIAHRSVQWGLGLGLVALWHLTTRHGRVSPLLLPPPGAVLDELSDVVKTGAFVQDLEVTLTELAVAFAIAATAGTMGGYLVSRSRYWTRVLEPLLSGIYSIPIILLLPLYVLIFGLGPPSKIALGATIAFFPVVLSAIAGFGNVDPTYVVSARSMGSSNYQLFRWVLLPAAFPVVVTGLRMGFTVALLAILGAETIASLSGLGHRIVNLAEGMEMARMYAFILLVVGIAVLLNSAVSLLERRARRF